MIDRIEIGLTYTTDNLEVLNRRLEDGFRIIGHSVYSYDGEVTELFTLYKPDNTAPKVEEEPDLSFEAHGDATSNGCVMCGNEWKSLNKKGYCSSCWTVWNS